MTSDVRRRAVRLHGHEVTYRTAGDDLPPEAPVLVLLHGITGSSSTWEAVLPRLGERFRVVAPDLLGHGESAKPRGDYSLGAYASGVRDLLALLGHPHATVVGHSLGGGVAMQFAYQHPEHCERLVLVCSGGLGREVSPVLRAGALPLAEYVLPLLAGRPVVRAGRAVGRLVDRLPLRPSAGVAEVARGFASLSDSEARAAFVHTLRSVVDVRGQRVDARDRLYLAEALPLLVVWGARDTIIPVSHGRGAAALAPGSRLVVFERSGHFPHADEPERFAALLADFVATTEPGRPSVEVMADRLRERSLA